MARTQALWLVVALLATARAAPTEHLLDLGEPSDEAMVGPGLWQAEPARPNAQHPFWQTASHRWCGNAWTLSLPVLPGQDNLVTFRAKFSVTANLEFGEGFKAALEGADDEGYEYAVVVPAEAAGGRETIAVRATMTPAVHPGTNDRDRRDRAMSLDWVKTQPLLSRPAGVPVATRATPLPPVTEHFLNIGVDGDEPYLKEGFYHHEGYSRKSVHPFYRWCSFRWFATHWAVEVPVYPGQDNLVTLRACFPGMMRLRVGGKPRTLFGSNQRGREYQIPVPKSLVGNQTSLRIEGTRSPPARLGEQDKRELAMTLDWILVQPVDQLPEDIMESYTMPAEPEADRPLADRLRGTEARPLYTDVASYVEQARLMRCNVMTIGPMNGQHYTSFPTQDGTPWTDMHPEYLRSQIDTLHKYGIDAIGWVVFNVQDLRQPEQCQAAQKHPEWTMKFLPWNGHDGHDRIGMCVVSSPWREMHGGILREAAAQGLDGAFFDGFYLGGIPHPSVPGCVCEYCQAKFKRDTGLETPTKVDFADPTFKRWMRWRNLQLLDTARYFQQCMKSGNPQIQVTFNYNLWPFGNKGWETAIPMWATSDFGVSQHAYTGRTDLEWVMLGFKCRLSHDLNPNHADVWRTSKAAFKYDDSPADQARHELTMRTFMLSALSNGVTPWHGGHISPPEIGIRVHQAVMQRENWFAHQELRHLGVVLSQNTFDFFGYQPDTDNLARYQDSILGTWLMLTEAHIPFRFVFDNQVEAGQFEGLRELLLVNTAAMSDQAAAQLKQFAANGGKVIATGESGELDEWADPRPKNALDGLKGLVRLDGDPTLDWVRTRDDAAKQAVLKAVAATRAPIVVEAPKTVMSNPMWSPDKQQVWVHLLNVSAFYPLGDTGFRGLGEAPVYAGDVASDGDIVVGGKVKRENVPVENILVGAPGFKVKSAKLAVAGTELKLDAQGRYVVPELDIQDTVVLSLE